MTLYGSIKIFQTDGGSKELSNRIVASIGVAQFLRHDIDSPATGVHERLRPS